MSMITIPVIFEKTSDWMYVRIHLSLGIFRAGVTKLVGSKKPYWTSAFEKKVIKYFDTGKKSKNQDVETHFVIPPNSVNSC